MWVRKFLGAFVLVFIAIPVLFGVTWAVGLIKATVSAEFLVDMPREIIDEIPGSIDALFLAAQDAKVDLDPETRAWFQAAAKSGISPRELMEKTGLQAWMRTGLSDSLRQAGEVLRGESPLRSVSLDMRPLKAALVHPEMDRFLEATLTNLPVCDENGLRAWQNIAGWGGRVRHLPACRPDVALAKDVFFAERDRAVRQMRDSVEMIEDIRPFPFQRLGVSRAVTAASILLFVFPAIFVLAGALIASPHPAGRLRWSGISVLAGSLPVLLMALGIRRFSHWFFESGYISWHAPWSMDVDRLFLDKLDWIPLRVVDGLFSPVVTVAGLVAVVGIVLIAISASARGGAKAPAA